jgi:haloalkane dehalogenase
VARFAAVHTLRTPDDRFENLTGFGFEPHYAEIADGSDDGAGGTLRVHYLDEGPADGPVVLLLHGEPSWCFLYRHMIPILTDAGSRVVAPDLVGFGRSDKPTDTSDYTFARHVEWMRELLFDVLDLHDIHYFGQDWGSLIGLRLVGEHPDRFAKVAIGNGGLPTGDGRLSEAFLAWQTFSKESPHFPIGRIVNGGCVTELPDDAVAGYDAPFPDDTYKAGARIFPSLVPTTPDDPAAAANRAAWETLRTFDKPFLCTFSDQDPILGKGDGVLKREIPGTRGQPHVTIEGGGHFLQEDCGPALARVLVDFFGS